MTFAPGPVVVKLGGRTFEDPAARRRLAGDVAAIARQGARPVVVHGGGARITAELATAGVEARFVRGLRVTDARTMEVAERVLTAIGRDLAAEVTAGGAEAVAVARLDRALFAAVKDPELGFVGEPTEVDEGMLARLLDLGMVPVVTPVAMGPTGGPLNVNADDAASAVARALKARALVLMTDVDGVLGADGRPIARLTAAHARDLVAKGVAKGGMVPKVENALATLAAGVGAVHIVNGARPDVLAEVAAGKAVGTAFVP